MESPTSQVPEDKMDRRVRRTRSLLQNGLLELMKEKPIRSISMRELCRSVDVCRTTPYLHYRDVQDILEQMEARLEQDLEAVFNANDPADAARDPKNMLLGLYGCVKQHGALWDILLSYRGDPAFTDKLRAMAEDYIQQLLFHKAEPRRSMPYAESFLLGGIVAILRCYAAGGCRETPEELLALTHRG